MSMLLSGRHALITGGGRGIGAAIAKALAAEGALVTLVGRDRDVLEQSAARLPPGAQANVVVGDVREESSIAAAFAAARARHGEVGILVNNAGIAVSRPFARLDPVTWSEVLATNLTGTYLCTREAVPAMIAAGHGRIVNVASTAGLVGGKYIAAYCAAKHGVVGFTRSLATELAAKGITVNAVCPGFTESAMLDRALASIASSTGRSEDDAAATLLVRNPLGRFVKVEEVASAVAWLCRPESGAVTGQAIVIDGGEVQH